MFCDYSPSLPLLLGLLESDLPLPPSFLGISFDLLILRLLLFSACRPPAEFLARSSDRLRLLSSGVFDLCLLSWLRLLLSRFLSRDPLLFLIFSSGVADL